MKKTQHLYIAFAGRNALATSWIFGETPVLSGAFSNLFSAESGRMGSDGA